LEVAIVAKQLRLFKSKVDSVVVGVRLRKRELQELAALAKASREYTTTGYATFILRQFLDNQRNRVFAKPTAEKPAGFEHWPRPKKREWERAQMEASTNV
jgi:hypothetical protein